MLLDRNDHVGQDRRAAGTGDHEEIGKALDRQPEIVERPVRPFLLQALAITPPDIDGQQRPGHRVEAGRKDDRIKSKLPVARGDTGGGDRADRIGLDIDNLDIGLVEGLIIMGVETGALGADREFGRGQYVGDPAVLDHAADLAADKLRERLIGLLVEQQIGKFRPEMRNRALVPQRLIALLPFFLGHGQGKVHSLLARHAGLGPARFLAVILIALLHRQLLFRDRAVARRN